MEKINLFNGLITIYSNETEVINKVKYAFNCNFIIPGLKIKCNHIINIYNCIVFDFYEINRFLHFLMFGFKRR